MKRTILVTVMSGLLVAACVAPEFPYDSVVDTAEGSVVRISVRRTDGTAGLATGFYVDARGTVFTADHVVQDAEGNLDTELIVVTHGGETHVQYQVARHFADLRAVAISPILGMAVSSVPVRFADSVGRGEPVMVVGWPQNRRGDNHAGLATRGTVAGWYGSEMLVLDMRSAAGASGAPVFNRHAEVIGMMDQVGLGGDPFAYAVVLDTGALLNYGG